MIGGMMPKSSMSFSQFRGAGPAMLSCDDAEALPDAGRV